MGISWAVVALGASAGTVAGLLLARAAVSRGLRSLPAEIGARCAAVHAMRRAAAGRAGCAAVIGTLAGGAAAPFAGPGVPADGLLLAMLVAALAASASVLPTLLDAEEVLQGPGWSRRATGRLWLWGTLHAGGAIPLGGALAAAGLFAVWPGAAAEPLVVAEAFMVGAALAMLGVARVFAAIGRPDAFPADVAAESSRLAGPGRLPDYVLWRTGGHGPWAGFSVAAGRRWRVIASEDVVARLPREQVLAILLHEIGHLRLGHLLRRKLLLIAALVVVPLALAAAGVAVPFVTFAASFGTSLLGARLSFARQEIAADAFAAAHLPAADMGAALVSLERAKLVPGDVRIALSHPALRDRLARLGLDADAMLAGP